MNPLIEEIYRTGQVRDAQGNLRAAFPAGISRSEGEALYRVIRATNARRTLEVGMAVGLSALFFCQAHRDQGGGQHVAVDPFQTRDFGRIGLRNIEHAGLADLLRFIELPSQQALPQLWREGEQFDFILIDGAHLFDTAMVDFFYADKLIPVGGLIMLDDLWMPAVAKVVSFALRNLPYEFVAEFSPPRPNGWRRWRRGFREWLARMTTGTLVPSPVNRYYGSASKVRWCVMRKTAPDTRDWQHFVPF